MFIVPLHCEITFLVLPHPRTPEITFLTPRSPLPEIWKNIDQRGTGKCGFNTENAIFEKLSPEVVNFAKTKSFS